MTKANALAIIEAVINLMSYDDIHKSAKVKRRIAI